MKFFEKRYAPLVYEVLNAQIKEFLALAKAEGFQEAVKKIPFANERLPSLLMGIYKSVGVRSANDKYEEIIRQVPSKRFGFNAEFLQEIISHFRMHLLDKAVFPISESTRKQILSVLMKGIEQGWGYAEIARELGDSDVTRQRALTIVRTESVKAHFEGEKLGRKKSGYQTTVEWMSAEDHRVRHGHRTVDGQVVGHMGRFKVPKYRGKLQIGFDYMEGPGDTTASKENLINCRCTSADRVIFDENGIAKKL